MDCSACKCSVAGMPADFDYAVSLSSDYLRTNCIFAYIESLPRTREAVCLGREKTATYPTSGMHQLQ